MKHCRFLVPISLTIILFACNPATKVNENTQSTTSEETTEVSSTSPQLKDCQLVLGFDAWEPYQYADVGGRIAGLDIELITQVANSIGCTLTYQQGTWVELLQAIKEGEIDMLVGASKTKSREEYALFSTAYRTEKFSLYIRQSDEQLSAYQSLDDFIDNDKRIGIVEDYYYGPKIAMLLDGLVTSKSFVQAIMGELNVARLLDNDIDAFVEDSFVGASLLRRKALSSRIKPHGVSFETGSVYVMFAKNNFSPSQLEQFNQQLTKLKNSAKFNDLVKKYSY